MSFAENLRKYRIAAGYKSARAFSEALGLSQSTYFNYEKGTREPSLETVNKIANALHVSVSDLLGFSEKEEASAADELEEKKRIVKKAGFQFADVSPPGCVTVIVPIPEFMKKSFPALGDKQPVALPVSDFLEWVEMGIEEYNEQKGELLHDSFYKAFIMKLYIDGALERQKQNTNK